MRNWASRSPSAYAHYDTAVATLYYIRRRRNTHFSRELNESSLSHPQAARYCLGLFVSISQFMIKESRVYIPKIRNRKRSVEVHEKNSTTITNYIYIWIFFIGQWIAELSGVRGVV